MFFSVVIPTYNRSQILLECIEALYKQSVSIKDYEVIIVDDGSTDNTATVVKNLRKFHPNLYYHFQKNQGQGVARNNAIKKAKGKVIVLIGDDIIATHDFLFEHQKLHYAHPEENSAVLGFTAWHPKLQINSFMRWMTDGSTVLGKFGGHQFAYEKLQGKEQADFNFFYTSNISLKRSLLNKFSFDQSFSGYGWEDIELGYRLSKEANLKIYYNASAIAYHDHFMTEDSLKGRMIAIGKSAWTIHRKYPELKKVPSAFKSFCFGILGNGLTLRILEMLNYFTKNKFLNFYYYALSKKYFLAGLKQGRNLFVK